MEALLSVSFGELFLKGANRKTFFNNALSHIVANIKDIGYKNTYVESAKLYIRADEDKFDALITEIKKVFGIAYIDEVYRVNKNLDEILEATKYVVDKTTQTKNILLNLKQLELTNHLSMIHQNLIIW